MSVQVTISGRNIQNSNSATVNGQNNSNDNSQIQGCSFNKKIGIGGAAGALFGGALPPLLLHGQDLAYITAPFSPTYGLVILVMVGATLGSTGGTFLASFVECSNSTQSQANSQMLSSAESTQSLWKRFFKC